ncbi:MAG: type II secretion system protein [Pyrinomonadaceae bacterium]|nr:type II secretion system protein [Pyrinomonadaceae bacterium]
MKTRKKQEGFSLVELLVVVIIIAIVAAIAIPSLLASRRAANEASAIASLRTIHSAQSTYFGINGNTSFGTVANLVSAGLIDSAIGSLSKSGYTFTLTLPASAPFSTYCANANATTQGSTGVRRFGVGNQGTIYQDPSATVTCAAGVLTPAVTASPIQ